MKERDLTWLQQWRLNNQRHLRQAEPEGETRQSKEWDFLRFGLRKMYGDEALSQVKISCSVIHSG